MKVKKWIAGLGLVLVAIFGGLGMTHHGVSVLGPTVADTVDPSGDGDHGIWP